MIGSYFIGNLLKKGGSTSSGLINCVPFSCLRSSSRMNRRLSVVSDKYENKIPLISGFKHVSGRYDFYNKTMVLKEVDIHSDRLKLSVLNKSIRDFDLIKNLNIEKNARISRWTPLQMPVNASCGEGVSIRILLQNQHYLHSRVWTINEKQNGRGVGLITTEELDKEGLAELSIHVLDEYSGKGVAKEAFNAVYRGYPLLPADFFKQQPDISDVKNNIILLSLMLTEKRLSSESLKIIEDRLADDVLTQSDIRQIVSFFPANLKQLVSRSLRSLSSEKTNATEKMVGFVATPVNERSVRLIRTCGFEGTGDVYKKYFP